MKPLDLPSSIDARPLTDAVLDSAVRERASDIHLEPTAGEFEVRLRIDGILSTVRTFDAETGKRLAGRFMVLAKLLTYRMDVPQEGRATVVVASADRPLDLRISVMPTTHGPRVAVRLPADLETLQSLEDIQLPKNAVDGLKQFAAGDGGMLIVTGPAGAGKTTTAYALLQHIARTQPGMSIVTLEDPVERDLPGVTQIEVTPFGERTYERCLRSILRQDPQVLMLGEIRDPATASLAVQAALSGHRMLCTIHAASAGGVITRLIEMGVEPYQLTSSLAGVLTQRLVRQLTSGGSYQGRRPIGSFIAVDRAARKAIMQRSDRDEMDHVFSQQPNFVSLRASADILIAEGVTDVEELSRIGIAR